MASGEYVCIVNDPSQELEDHEYYTTAATEEGALLNAQEAFPCGVIKAVHEADYLNWIEGWAERAKRKRAQEQHLEGPLGELIRHLADMHRL